MPYADKKDRKYGAQRKYNATPDATAKRVANNAARQSAIKKGAASVGDGTDVDHIKPLSKGGGNAPSNLRVVPAAKNRSFTRNSDHSLRSNKKK